MATIMIMIATPKKPIDAPSRSVSYSFLN